MNKESMLAGITALKTHKEMLLAIAERFMIDSDKSLDDRWEVFTQIHEFLPTEGDYMTFESLGDNWSWYDDMFADRYKTVELVDLVERVEDAHGDDRWPHIDLDALKEEILASGYGRFINDW